MSHVPRPVSEALERWHESGLVTPAQAETLRAEAEAHGRGGGRRAFQYVLAATGGLVVLIAAAVLADWAWPRLGDPGRCFVLMAAGFVVHLLGLQLEHGERWRPAAYLMQTAGLLIVLFAFAYSERPWPDLTTPAVVIGIGALVLPLVLAYRSIGRDPFMPAVHVAIGLSFLAVFLDRATPLDEDGIVWVLDGVLVLIGIALLARLRRAGRSEDARDDAWALNAFVAAMYAGFVLVGLTAAGPFDLDDGTVWALDAWLLGMVALTLWGIHRAPPALQREWFGLQLALGVVMAVPLCFYTTLEALDAPPETAALACAALGGLAMAYGLRREVRSVLVAGCLALLIAAWYYGVERGGVLGAVAALAATAALLFWLSARLGRDAGRGDAAPASL
jgi:hypothetical protein